MLSARECYGPMSKERCESGRIGLTANESKTLLPLHAPGRRQLPYSVPELRLFRSSLCWRSQ